MSKKGHNEIEISEIGTLSNNLYEYSKTFNTISYFVCAKSQEISLSTDGYFLQRVIFFERARVNAEGDSGREAGAERIYLSFPTATPLRSRTFKSPARGFYFVCDLDELWTK